MSSVTDVQVKVTTLFSYILRREKYVPAVALVNKMPGITTPWNHVNIIFLKEGKRRKETKNDADIPSGSYRENNFASKSAMVVPVAFWLLSALFSLRPTNSKDSELSARIIRNARNTSFSKICSTLYFTLAYLTRIVLPAFLLAPPSLETCWNLGNVYPTV